MSLRRGLAIAASVLAGFVALPAIADTASGFGQWQYSAGVLLDQYTDGAPPKWSFGVGAGAQVAPRYDGASGQRFEAYPLGEIRYRDVAYASVSEGIGYNVLHRENQRAGIALNWDFGRPSGRIEQTRGVDRLHSGPLADLYFEQSLLGVGVPVVLRADVRHSLTRDDGFKAEFGAYVPVPLSQSVFLFAGPSIVLGDATAEARQYGVSSADAASSGFAAHDTRAGLESLRVGANLVWVINPHWLVEGLATWTQLQGSAGSSPLTNRRNSGAFGAAIGYSF